MKFFLLITIFISFSYSNLLESMSFNDALKRAVENDKMIMVMYEQDNCIACDKINNEIFENVDLVSLIEENFYYVSINISYDKKLRGLPVRGTPTIYVLNKDKKLLKKSIGAMKIKAFTNMLNEILETQNKEETNP